MRQVFWLFLVVSITFSGLAAAEEDSAEGDEPSAGQPKLEGRPAVIDSQLQQLLAVVQSVSQDETMWLNGAEMSADAMYALYRPANTPRVQGVALLLHDQGQHPDWPRILQPLRKGLPDAGWHTLAPALHYPQGAGSPVRRFLSRSDEAYPYPDAAPREEPGAEPGQATEPDGAPAEAVAGEEEAAADAPDLRAQTDAETDRIEAEAAEADAAMQEQDVAESPAGEEVVQVPGNQERLAAAMRQLEGLNEEYRLIISVGSAVDVLLDYLLANPGVVGEGLALVWVDAELNTQKLITLSQRNPRLLTLPVLDLYSADPMTISEAVAARKDFARRSNMPRYLAVGSHRIVWHTPDATTQLVRRVRSWLAQENFGKFPVRRKGLLQ